MAAAAGQGRDWPVRAWALALAGAGVGIASYRLVNDGATADAGRLALAALLAVTGAVFAVTVERERQPLAAGFALAAGLVVAAVIYWSGGGPTWDAGATWRLTCALIAVAIAAPLFQAWRDGPAGIPYSAAHNRAWTNVVLWFASWAFVGIAWLLAWLLSALFDLIGITLLSELLRRPWFAPLLSGAAFGGAVGLLRDRERILGTLQRVVTIVLSVLAPVLAAGLLAFLIALPFTGLTPLWGATKSTTPILLACVIGALILANAVIADLTEDESRQPVLRWAAIGLGLAMLPLGTIAAVSTGARIGQYGLSPDRLWAVVFTGIACAYGLAYWVALVRARTAWAAPVRVANLRLAIGLCGLAVLLSTPLLGFGAISTRDQLARLEDGRTKPDKFDWAALRFDFGPAGKAAVEHAATAGRTAEIRRMAAAVLKADNRWNAVQQVETAQSVVTLDQRLVILPVPVALPDDLRRRLTQYDACADAGACAVIYTPGANEAFVARAATRCGSKAQCPSIVVDIEGNPARTLPAMMATRLTRGPKGWLTDETQPRLRTLTPAERKVRDAAARAEEARRAAVIRSRAVEVREVRRRQIFVGGEPVGEAFP